MVILMQHACLALCMPIVCSAPLNGQVDCGNGLVNVGLEGENCDFSCDSGYMLQENVTSGTCENTGNWSPELLLSGSGTEGVPFSGSWSGLPSCVPLNCSEDDLPVPVNTVVLQLPSCGLEYQSQCTVSCAEGFTGDDVTYLCNVTSDPTMVDWMVINGTATNPICQRGLLLKSYDNYIHRTYVNLVINCVYLYNNLIMHFPDLCKLYVFNKHTYVD